MKKIPALVLVLIVAAAMPGSANEFKEGGKEIGEGFKKLGKEVAHVTMTSGKAVGKGFKEAGKETGHAFKKMGKDIGEAFKGK